MLEFVVFVILWPIFWLVLGFLMNWVRVVLGVDVRDGFSEFLKAMVLPPLAILGAFSPHARASGNSGAMLLGGVVGTVLGLCIFLWR
ncbi:MAG: hypothetical protein ACO22Z_03000 [Paracoccaceae bacterium]